MKTRNLFLGLAIVVLGFASCKDEKETEAKKMVEAYIVYVDSLDNMTVEDAQTNWAAIDAEYQIKEDNVESALKDLSGSKDAELKVSKGKEKYEMLKTEVEAVKAAANVAVLSPKQKMRNALFGEGKIGDDMNFNWVNKDNIHSVYQQFVHTVENNKDSYSREDWDEIKTMYEALDSRKNTVEKEGLSSEDNRKIAGLKLKFAPMYRLNRMGAKSEEMKEAKQ
ncbi:hypothetical protein NAT51_12155 [Flavobacterium amniphilum]|uniref:DUF6565 domain-containing protein n=1 Tax=Flavobacterium amniphilum TaxID=1834035 RepID=UPI00202A205E|nr:DUF6565 domain-containing protein [Flavobacterium amniphilum]MCL9806281.1 hypothetical protein [Flavobacterium amniphilum]